MMLPTVYLSLALSTLPNPSLHYQEAQPNYLVCYGGDSNEGFEVWYNDEGDEWLVKEWSGHSGEVRRVSAWEGMAMYLSEG